jgi:methyl-accepting chemotaxis protein
MESSDVTLEVLKSIRDEIKDTKTVLSQRLDQTNARLDQTNARLDQTNARLGRMSARLEQTNERLDQTNVNLHDLREELSTRIVHSEIRVATAITDLAGTVSEMTSAFRASGEVRPRLERCEQDIRELRERLDRVDPR